MGGSDRRGALAIATLAFVVSGCCYGFSSPTGIGAAICFPPRPRCLWLWRAVAEGDAGPCAVGLRDDRGLVELAGIACPEGRNDYLHEEVADAVRAMAAGSRVRVEPVLGDSAWDWSMFPPSKTRGYLFLPDGTLLNAELIRRGLVAAGDVDDLPDAERLRAAEREAREQRRGRWHGTWTPLQRAAADGDAAAVAAALEAGDDVNARDPFGYTPLMLALAKGDPAFTKPDCALAVIAAGASVASSNRSGETPLMVAAANGNAELIALLRAAGADPHAKDRMGWNAFRRAKSPEVRQSLLGRRCPAEDDRDGSQFVWRAFERAGVSYPYVDKTEFERLNRRQDGPFQVVREGRPRPGDVGVGQGSPRVPMMIADPEADRAWDIEADSDAITACGPHRSLNVGDPATWFRFRGDLPPEAVARVIDAARAELRRGCCPEAR